MAVFFVFLTPGEAIHDLYDHHDTEHAQKATGVSYDEVHTHCTFLQFDAEVFDAVELTHTPESWFAFAAEFTIPAITIFITPAVAADSRGPPVC
ncbi:MAG: hypothetical protein ACRCYO_11695 [Bacteroidia bacterium]